jgi:hypothetical protein
MQHEKEGPLDFLTTPSAPPSPDFKLLCIYGYNSINLLMNPYQKEKKINCRYF